MGIGSDLKNALSTPGGWKIGSTGFGEILPHHDNRILLDKRLYDKDGLVTSGPAIGKQKTDKWGTIEFPIYGR